MKQLAGTVSSHWFPVALLVALFISGSSVLTASAALGKSLGAEDIVFNVDLATPNGMTPGESKEIYEEKQNNNTLPGHESESQDRPQTDSVNTTDTSTERPSGLDSDMMTPEKFTPEKSKEIHQSKWLFPMIITTTVALGLMLVAVLLIRKRKK